MKKKTKIALVIAAAAVGGVIWYQRSKKAKTPTPPPIAPTSTPVKTAIAPSASKSAPIASPTIDPVVKVYPELAETYTSPLKTTSFKKRFLSQELSLAGILL